MQFCGAALAGVVGMAKIWNIARVEIVTILNMRCRPSSESVVAGSLNLILDLPVGLNPCHYRVGCGVFGRRDGGRLNPVEHCAQVAFPIPRAPCPGSVRLAA